MARTDILVIHLALKRPAGATRGEQIDPVQFQIMKRYSPNSLDKLFIYRCVTQHATRYPLSFKQVLDLSLNVTFPLTGPSFKLRRMSANDWLRCGDCRPGLFAFDVDGPNEKNPPSPPLAFLSDHGTLGRKRNSFSGRPRVIGIGPFFLGRHRFLFVCGRRWCYRDIPGLP